MTLRLRIATFNLMTLDDRRATPCEVHDVLDKIYSLRNSPPDCFSQIRFSFVDEFGASCLKKARKNAPDNRSVLDKQ